MGIKKGIFFSLAGIVAVQYAAYELDAPHLGHLCSQVVDALGGSNSIGAIANSIEEFFVEYAKDSTWNGFATLGTVGQFSMYGGLVNIAYNLIKKCIKNPPEEIEQTPKE